MKRHKSNQHHPFLAHLVLLILLFAAPGLASVSGHETSSAAPAIRSATEIDYPPFCFVESDGQATGFAVELLRATVESMGRPVTFRSGSWAEVKGLLEKSQVDVLPLVGRTPEREAAFDFSFPFLSLRGAIVVRDSRKDIHVLNDLRDRTVEVMQGDNAEEFLRREDRGIEIRTTKTFDEALRDLSQGRCDAVVIQRMVAEELISQLGLSDLKIIETPIAGFRQDFSFAVHDGDKAMLALINEGLAHVIANGTYRRLKTKWFSELELRADRHFVIGGDENYPPYEYLDAEGQPAGYNVDLTRAIAKALDLNIEIRLGPWPEIMRGLQDGSIDAIEGLFYSNARNQFFDFTQAHTMNHCVAVVRKGEGDPPISLAGLKDKRIVVQQGDIMHDFAMENGLRANLATTPSQEEALRELAEGRYDCALVSRMCALYLIKTQGWDNLAVGSRPLLSPEYCYAVLNDNQILLANLSEGLEILDRNGQYQQIRQKWLGVYDVKSLPISTILRYAAMVILPLLLILITTLLWLWSLRKQVAARTAQLRQSEEKHRALYENAPLPYQSLDMNGCFLDVNPAWLHALGYTREEVIGAWFGDFIPPADAGLFKKTFTELQINGSINDREFTMLHKDGHTIQVAYEGRIDTTLDPQHQQTYAVFKNITQQRRAEEALRESERFLRSTLDGLSANIALLDEEGVILLVNKAWRDFASQNGLPPESVSEGVNYLRICDQSTGHDSGEAIGFSEGIRAVLSGKMRSYAQEYAYRNNHRDRWFAGKVTIFPGEGPRRVVVAHEDITERKQAVESLRHSEAHHRTLVEAIPDLVWLKDVDGVYLSCNPTFERFFGACEAGIVGKTDYDFTTKEQADFFRDNDRKAMALNRPRVNEEWLTFAGNGYHGLFETIKTPMRDATGTLIGVLGISRDITERQKAGNALRERESLLRAVVDNIPFEFWARDKDGRCFMENAPLVRHWGSLLGKRIEDAAITEDVRDLWIRNNNRARLGEIVHDTNAFDTDGQTSVYQNIIAPIRIGDQIQGVLGLNIDITERHRAEEKLRSTNDLMETTLESLHEAVFVVDFMSHTIIQSNHAAERLFGFTIEELVGQTTEMIHVDHESFQKFSALGVPILEGGDVFHIEYRMKTKDGTIIDTENTVTAMDEWVGLKKCVVSVVRDITERKRAEDERQNLEKQLRQAQKMESVGRLAGGVAHDFNNMLSVIIGYTDLAMMKLPADNPAAKALHEVRQAAQRSADLTRQLLAFARKQTIMPKVLDLNDTISSMLKMLGRMIGEDIELQWKPGADLWTVKMDPVQLDQIMANLVVNARDAIEGVGKVTIETGKVQFDEAYCAQHLGSLPGEYVLIAVSDNGAGMDKETLSNIFEPFFTTKPQGEGTGLGLATVYGIIKQNEGFVNVYSEPNEGTTFRIYLPRMTEATDLPPEAPEAAAPSTGTETILVVEDEAPLLSLTSQLLQNFGYTVLAAGAPARALEIVRDYPESIDLLLTDVIMPEMSGRDLCTALTVIRPELKCIFMSGYTANIIAHHGILNEGVQFLQKPFTAQDLAKRLRLTLDS